MTKAAKPLVGRLLAGHMMTRATRIAFHPCMGAQSLKLRLNCWRLRNGFLRTAMGQDGVWRRRRWTRLLVPPNVADKRHGTVLRDGSA